MVDANKPQSEHQQSFEKVCEIVGWDYKVLDKNISGQVAQTLGVLKGGGYTLADLNRFLPEVWSKDWRWEKHKQYPTLTQLRQEIGKLKSKRLKPNVSIRAFDDSDEPEYLKRARQGLGANQ